MPASVFSGLAVKILKKILKFKDSNITIATGDTDNPTSVAKDGIRGSLYIRSGTGDIYIKQDDGVTTNWNLMLDVTDAANRALSNLTTTQINAHLLPDSPGTYNIGESSAAWNIIFSDIIRKNLSGPFINLTQGILVDEDDGDSLDYNFRVMRNPSFVPMLDWSGANLSVQNVQIVDLADPTLADSATTKSYVDNLFEGVKPKEACQLATTANITLSGNQTIDGVSSVDGDRILVKDQTLPEENGIYISDSGVWTRSTDFDSLTPINEIKGAIVGVAGGIANSGKIFVCNSDPVTLNVDPITFVYFNSVATLNAGNGIDITGTTISVQHDDEGLAFSSGNLILELDGNTLSKSATGLKVAADGITNTEVNASAAIAYSKLNLANSIVDADVAAAAAIARSKLATGTANRLTYNASPGGALSDLAAITASRALESDVNGLPVASSVTATELSYVSGVTSSIQVQLDSKIGANTISAQSSSFVAASNFTYLVDSSGGPITVTLPAPSLGAQFIIKDTGSASTNNITVSGGTIDGQSSYVESSDYGSKQFLSNGTLWFII